MTRRLLAAAALCILAWEARAMGKAPPPESERPAAQVPARRPEEAGVSEWRGQSCGIAAPKAVLVADADAWAELWKSALSGEPPAVDFTKHVAAAVFLGLKNTGGYSVEFLEPETSGGNTVLRWRMKTPGKGSFVIQAFTQPYAIKLFPKPAGPAVLKSSK